MSVSPWSSAVSGKKLGGKMDDITVVAGAYTRHSSIFRLNVSAFRGIGGCIQGLLRGC